MSRCSRCGHENPSGASACAACSLPLAQQPIASPREQTMSPLGKPPQTPTPRTPFPGSPGAQPSSLRCSACGLAVGAARFCSACGTPVNAPPQAPTAPRARVALLAGDGSVMTTWPLIDKPLVVGTSGDVRLTDSHAAPAQGRIRSGPTGLAWESADTPNGTFALIRKPTVLRVGDELRVGRQLLRFEAAPLGERTPHAFGSPDPGYRYRLVQRLEGGVEGDIFPLRDGENLIGRAAGDISFPTDGYVSSRHATLTVSGDELTVVDLGSSNGTFVRLGRRSVIAAGDLLLIGEQLLRVDA